MKLTPARHAALAHLSNGKWRYLHWTAAPTTIGALYRAGYIRSGYDIGALQDRLWTITPAGLDALREAGE